ncbi:MAG: hydrogenase maturation nickel metallochaperone HypA [Rhodospirillales bacterium]|nr:hydrogenase maturation nickel metallochaperone HypA [Rhodospirillales bacterium]
MHEMSLTEGVIRVLEDQAATHGFTKVKTIWLEIGELSSVDPGSMAFCFEAVSRGTLAEGAVLDIIRVPGNAFCMGCGRSVALARLGEPCPECGSYLLTVTAGEEMRVKELEVE